MNTPDNARFSRTARPTANDARTEPHSDANAASSALPSTDSNPAPVRPRRSPPGLSALDRKLASLFES